MPRGADVHRGAEALPGRAYERTHTLVFLPAPSPWAPREEGEGSAAAYIEGHDTQDGEGDRQATCPGAPGSREAFLS